MGLGLRFSDSFEHPSAGTENRPVLFTIHHLAKLRWKRLCQLRFQREGLRRAVTCAGVPVRSVRERRSDHWLGRRCEPEGLSLDSPLENRKSKA
jgi:hypothetical protein